MQKITRIAYNTKDWQRPSGDAGAYEVKDTYNHTHGFGHEEWLFRSEWLIDGWRYAFVQGVNKSRKKLIDDGRPFDLTLFTIQPDKRRRYVATIRSVECLDDKQAADAAERFKELGWYKTMLKEIGEVGGEVSGLGDAKYATSIVNVRYRLENVHWYGSGVYAKEGDPVLTLNRYQLFDIDRVESKSVNERKREPERLGRSSIGKVIYASSQRPDSMFTGTCSDAKPTDEGAEKGIPECESRTRAGFH